jgi:hypothetical protein
VISALDGSRVLSEATSRSPATVPAGRARVRDVALVPLEFRVTPRTVIGEVVKSASRLGVAVAVTVVPLSGRNEADALGAAPPTRCASRT